MILIADRNKSKHRTDTVSMSGVSDYCLFFMARSSKKLGVFSERDPPCVLADCSLLHVRFTYDRDRLTMSVSTFMYTRATPYWGIPPWVCDILGYSAQERDIFCLI